MNTVDSSSDSPLGSSAAGLEEQLMQYLLAAQPGCIAVIGQPPGLKAWQQQAEDSRGPQVMLFDSLDECLASMPDTEDTTGDNAEESHGHCVALMCLKTSGDASDDEDGLASALGQAVRRFPERLIVSTEMSEPDDAAFFAFGFRRLQLDGQGSIRLFEYCLSEYKQVPDWLNARYWANPERYGLTDDQNSYSEDGEDDEEE